MRRQLDATFPRGVNECEAQAHLSVPLVFDDAAAGESHSAMRTRCQVQVVRDEHERGAQFFVQLHQHLDDAVAGVGVEIAGRFVGEQDLRLVRERACERDALLFAAGELGRIVVRAFCEADTLEETRARDRALPRSRDSRAPAAP